MPPWKSSKGHVNRLAQAVNYRSRDITQTRSMEQGKFGAAWADFINHLTALEILRRCMGITYSQSRARYTFTGAHLKLPHKPFSGLEDA